VDAVLLREAAQSLEALRRISSRGTPGGVLLGHRRDHRFYIEKAFPCPFGISLTPKIFFELDRVFEGQVIGFFSFPSGARKTRSLLRPFGFGKLYVEVYRNPGETMTTHAFVIEYEKRFILLPIPLKFDKTGGKN